jgi:D-alanyl-D-alanine dipeptidase
MRMSRRSLGWIVAVALPIVAGGCAARTTSSSAPSPMRSARDVDRSPVASARQLVLVTTPAWDSTSGTLRRFERDATGNAWRAVGAAIPIVVGRTGVAWDDAILAAAPGEPVKREGDGRSPAGAFALDTAFGFPVRESVPWVRLPYTQLRETTECVDDGRSAHYNTIVDRGQVPTVDWTSAEHMRAIEQYTLGIHVSYNAPPKAGRGSCIFLHVWAGPSSTTAGCTAMELSALQEVLRWLAPEQRPMIVQLPTDALTRVRGAWGLP